MSDTGTMFDTIFEDLSLTSGLSISISSVLICIAVSLLLGVVISGAYFFTTPRKDRSASFVLSLVILPTIVGVVIILIGGNLARAFSMAGIFTIVRFRSVPGDSKDITFVFLSMAEGLATGLGYLALGAVVAVVVGAVIVLVNKSGYGVMRQKEKKLRITIPEDMNYQGAFEDIFTKYTNYAEIQKVRTSNMGTLFELSYDIIPKAEMNEKEFIDALRCRNGNLSIQLSIKDNKEQQL
ncbi:MAG: hypothetical protein K0R46_812 [Herbinix sp.]|jgi:hypothetical protein|nr:hypothetical protein [Herbinix sp.]